MSKNVVIYTTRFCPYCIRAKMLLKEKGVEYSEIAVDQDPEKRQEMSEKSGRFTVPQIWIGDDHIGGCDELYQLQRQGTLDELLK